MAMRWKIILANGMIVAFVTLFSFLLLREGVRGIVAHPAARRAAAEHALRAANTQLSLDALRLERWLVQAADSAEAVEVFAAGTAAARQEAATVAANRLRDRAVAQSEFGKMNPSLLLFVDADGVGLGRNGSELMRGDDVGRTYPSLLSAMRSRAAGSAVWLDRQRQEQMFVAYAPVYEPSGAVRGALVLGTPLNDERLERTSGLTSGGGLALFADGHRVASGGPGAADLGSEAAARLAAEARPGAIVHSRAGAGESFIAAAPLEEYDSSRVILVAQVPASLLAGAGGVLWPLLAVGGLGLFLVIVAGVLLGNYISRPIAELEGGLLRVINGEEQLRFDLDHDELGGLSSRINTLLSSLQGLSEDE